MRSFQRLADDRRDDVLCHLLFASSSCDDVLRRLLFVSGGCDDVLRRLLFASGSCDDVLRRRLLAGGSRHDAPHRLPRRACCCPAVRFEQAPSFRSSPTLLTHPAGRATA